MRPEAPASRKAGIRVSRFSGIPGRRREPRAGFTLVEALAGLGMALGLAAAVAGVAGAVRLALARAEKDARAGRATGALYAEARMGGAGGLADVPGEEGRWAVTPRGGERVAAGGEGGWAERWRIEASEREAGGERVSLEALGEPVRP